MFSAVSSVVAEPMASTVYGATSARPSIAIPSAVSVKLLEAPMRTGPNCTASAPAPAQLLDDIEQVLSLELCGPGR